MDCGDSAPLWIWSAVSGNVLYAVLLPSPRCMDWMHALGPWFCYLPLNTQKLWLEKWLKGVRGLG